MPRDVNAEAPAVPHGSIFRPYDIRGVVGRDLDAAAFYALGRAVAAEARARNQDTVTVGRDGRLSSEELQAAVVRGLRAGGVDVIDVGRVPTPELYFAAYRLSGGTGVMVTASHNPVDYNGLKVMIGRDTLHGEAIADLRRRLVEGDLSRGEGGYRATRVTGEYLHRVTEDVRLQRPLHVVVDAGNGVAGDLALALFDALGCRVTPMYCEVDGRFPHHHPDPSRPENLRELMERVVAEGADIGLAFDGDGDRLGVVTAAGRIVWPDRLLMLFVGEALACRQGAAVLFDVKSSRHLCRLVEQYGGRPVMWKSGHSLLKAKMAEEGAVLAGEMSGHLFFADRWCGFDDALYAAARLLAVVARAPSAEAAFGALPDIEATPEIFLPMPFAAAAAFMERLLALPLPQGARPTTLDGLRLDFDDAWGLVRASNTTPALTLRFEADDVAAMGRVQGVFRGLLLAVDPELPVPF